MSTAVTVPELPNLASAPDDGLIPFWYQGKLYHIERSLVRGGGIRSITDFGVSTSNSGIANDEAIALAFASGATEFYWPDGVYTSFASIPSLHAFKHYGPGRILRGSDTFYVAPRYGQTNRLYVSTSGSTSNDGLSSSQPLTLTQAAATLRNYGPVLGGTWVIVGAAGTYSTSNVKFDTPSRDWVTVQGPTAGHPNVPTMILDGTGAGANKFGFLVQRPGVQVWFQDVKCQNYNNGTQNSGGWAVTYNATAILVNCHGSNADFGSIVADGADTVLVKGGRYSGRSGIIANSTNMTVGYQATSTADSTIIDACTQNGIYWSRGSQGHIDYVNFLAATPYHVQIESAARAHILGCDFRLASTAAITTNTDGSYYDDVSIPNNYNDGTGLANAKRYEHRAYSGSQQGWCDAAVSEMCIYAENPGSSLTSAVKAQVGSDLQMPNGVFSGQAGQLRPNYFVDKKTKIRIKVWGDTPNAAASFGVDFFDGTTTTSMAYSAFVGTPGAAGFEYNLDICPLTPTTQRGYANLASSAGGQRIESGATAANMANPQTIKLMAQSASGAMLVRRVEVWVMG